VTGKTRNSKKHREKNSIGSTIAVLIIFGDFPVLLILSAFIDNFNIKLPFSTEFFLGIFVIVWFLAWIYLFINPYKGEPKETYFPQSNNYCPRSSSTSNDNNDDFLPVFFSIMSGLEAGGYFDSNNNNNSSDDNYLGLLDWDAGCEDDD